MVQRCAIVGLKGTKRVDVAPAMNLSLGVLEEGTVYCTYQVLNTTR